MCNLQSNNDFLKSYAGFQSTRMYKLKQIPVRVDSQLTRFQSTRMYKLKHDCGNFSSPPVDFNPHVCIN